MSDGLRRKPEGGANGRLKSAAQRRQEAAEGRAWARAWRQRELPRLEKRYQAYLKAEVFGG